MRRVGIEAGKGLIEEEEVGIVQESPRQGGSLQEAAREPAYRLIRAPAQIEEFERGVDAFLEVAQPAKGTDELQVFASGELSVEKAGVGDKAQFGFQLRRVLAQVAAVEERPAFAGARESGERAEQGGFAGAVRTIKENGLTGLDTQRDPAQRGEVAKVFRRRPGAQERAGPEGLRVA